MSIDDIYEIYDSAERKWLVDNCGTVRGLMQRKQEAQQPVSVSLEKCARELAIQIYHEEGLETMNYKGQEDFADKEWQHYKSRAESVLDAAGVSYGE